MQYITTISVELEMKPPPEHAAEGSRRASRLRQHLAAIAMSIGALGTGTTLGWTSVAIPELQCGYASAAGAQCYQSWQLSWVSGCMSLGALAFSLPVGRLADVLGRKRAGLCLGPLFLAGWAFLIWGDSLALLCVGRLLTGAAGGAFNVLAPVYIAEVAQKEVRGALCSYFQLLLTVGTLYVYMLGAVTGLFWTSVGCAVVPAVFLVALSLVPETPPYLLQGGAGRGEGGSGGGLREREVRALREGLSTPAAGRGIVAGLGLVTCFQLCGINAVLFYASDIFLRASGGALEADTSAVVVGAMQVVATLVASLVVDRAGRRPLLVASAAVVGLCALLLGAYFQLDSSGEAEGLDWLPLASLCLFVVAFSLGLGPVTWVLLGELYAPEVRAFAGSLCCLVSWTFSFLVTTFFSELSSAVGVQGTFWIFGSVAVAGALFVFFVVPETKDRSLEEVQRQLSGGARVWSLSCTCR
ncbi:solute carrier family 2, facilitated glucose transporter member 8-like [Schistocerca serialis cubense]|uniref:solute carrier family 2, facilitated glucose transporter member 8-like n=1 Tax=Schistocerca serialis cubense TaxID=2023355 RepID=UPI00214F283F|nr:solute carrier family 2, facilitated glucose transporter member 8-like [Schistocerca serialis cubense]